MDLPVARLGPAGSGGRQQTAACAGSDAGGGPGGGGPGGSAQLEAGGWGSWEQLELAGLLGDEGLLDRWRMDNSEQAAWPGSAPPAPACEAELQAGTEHSLAQAVLSGLPADDEAVAVARMAAAAGRSIQEVAAMSRGEDYGATAYRVALRGRIQAGGAEESLYAEAASWTDPATLEKQLQRAAERRKRPLTGQELRAVKQRKAEMKEKKKVGWLFT
ncbi:hypothetical protein C2E20_0493 [Micractinium conductrix]|uniref:Uncharacterized protein n=1 Tax=Micractinium conductrix TaxID=554055 RepID=A0A2P6VQR9_9CHLO|nr:hypothetical protein C2E20_0493 [Micractinium conductrix]|eukprot:PSC76444.1 hypothetical protein C2E20_0493 [Micractinium conductrix]